MILIDANILLDLLSDDPVWGRWSRDQLDRTAVSNPLVINEVVYAELSVRAARVEDTDTFLQTMEIDVRSTPRPALFLAAKVFSEYRRRGGTRTGVLPDFFVGAYATVAGLPLLTRDPRRFRTYFPTVELISP